jgi:hypothetical protein
MIRIVEVFDFIYCPVFLKTPNTTFRELYQFPSSGVGRSTYCIGPVVKSWTGTSNQLSAPKYLQSGYVCGR